MDNVEYEDKYQSLDTFALHTDVIPLRKKKQKEV